RVATLAASLAPSTSPMNLYRPTSRPRWSANITGKADSTAVWTVSGAMPFVLTLVVMTILLSVLPEGGPAAFRFWGGKPWAVYDRLNLEYGSSSFGVKRHCPAACPRGFFRAHLSLPATPWRGCRSPAVRPEGTAPATSPRPL